MNYSPVGILCAVHFWAITAEITQKSNRNSHGALESSYGHCLNKFLMHYHAQIPWNRRFSAMNRSDSDHCLRRPLKESIIVGASRCHGNVARHRRARLTRCSPQNGPVQTWRAFQRGLTEGFHRPIVSLLLGEFF